MAYDSYASTSFFKLLRAMPKGIRRAARDQNRRFKSDNARPGLEFKQLCRVKDERLFSARVSDGYRVLGVPLLDESEPAILWFWIGTHAEYDRKWRAFCYGR